MATARSRPMLGPHSYNSYIAHACRRLLPDIPCERHCTLPLCISEPWSVTASSLSTPVSQMQAGCVILSKHQEACTRGTATQKLSRRGKAKHESRKGQAWHAWDQATAAPLPLQSSATPSRPGCPTANCAAVCCTALHCCCGEQPLAGCVGMQACSGQAVQQLLPTVRLSPAYSTFFRLKNCR